MSAPLPGPAVSVIIPVRDDADGLGRCLSALAAQRDAPAFEVVVGDNASRDATAEVAAGHPLRPRVVAVPEGGSYAARNAAAAVATAPVLAFTDADCVPDPDWVRAAFAAIGGADLVGGRIRITTSARPSAAEQWDVGHYLDQEAYVDQGFAATANLIVSRGTFDLVGGFGQSLRSSGDLDFFRRSVAAGARLVYGADVVVSHAARTTLSDLWRVNRRLGAGWHALARTGGHPPAWRDPWMWPSPGHIAYRARARGVPVRRVPLAFVHGTAIVARWTGRIIGP